MTKNEYKITTTQKVHKKQLKKSNVVIKSVSNTKSSLKVSKSMSELLNDASLSDRTYTPASTQPIKRRTAKRDISLKPAPKVVISNKTRILIKLKALWKFMYEVFTSFDYLLLLCVLTISSMGIIAVHSATLSFNSTRYDKMQIIMLCIGFGLMLIMSLIDYRKIMKLSKLLLIANTLIMVLTIFFGVGPGGSTDVSTNANWLMIGNIGVQPSEFSKILFIIVFAEFLYRLKNDTNAPKSIFGILVCGILFILPVLLQKDLGMTIVFCVIFLGMAFIAKIKIRYFFISFGAVICSAPFLWEFLDEYQQRRILVGFNPELDPLYHGFQAIRSKIAVGAGGFNGMGYMNGNISQSSNFPAKQTDMIFAVFGEEFGFAGALLMLLMFSLLILRIIFIAKKSNDIRGIFICAGIGTMLMFQIIENISMCLGIMPIIGITLPFISYGGSSALSMYILMGLLMSVYSHSDKYCY